ncbi:MAG: hypothetical protein WDN10_05100 [bacterium]
MTKYLSSPALALALALLAVTPAAAATIDVDASGSTAAGSAVSVSSDSSAGASTDIVTPVKADVQVTTSQAVVQPGARGTTTGSGTIDTGSGMQGSVSADGGVQAGLGILNVTRANADSMLSAGAEVGSSGMVSDRQSLSTYAAATLKGDTDLEGVEFSGDHVAVSYKERAHLFGFIPLWVTARAQANADGSVKVSYPWYGFLMSTASDDIEAQVKADATATLSGSGASAMLSATTQAKLFDQLRRAMKAAHDTEVSADVDASASGSAASGY